MSTHAESNLDPALADLKAALEGLRDERPDAWAGRHGPASYGGLARLFLAAEACGLLSEPEPTDKLGVAVEALERIEARWGEESHLIARAALAAIKEPRT